MKSLLSMTVSLITILSTNAFAITRVIDCTSNSNSDDRMSLVLRGGNATIYTCTGSPCSQMPAVDLIPSELAVLDIPDQSSKTLHYKITDGFIPAKRTVDITFGASVEVTIDGDNSLYSCE